MPSEDWRKYYTKTGERPPRKTLIKALQNFDTEKNPKINRNRALDLGCGNGRDTIELLRRGWEVIAVDAEINAIEGLQKRKEVTKDSKLKTINARFEQIELPEVDLINSSFSLPLVPPQIFPDIWGRLLTAVRTGGRISCQLYGNRDSWVGDPTITFFTKSAVDTLLQSMEIEYFYEEDDESVTPRGVEKHWHIFHIMAKKP